MRKKIVFYTGAGVSAESGLPTFRGENGTWDTFNPEEVASIKALQCGRSKDCDEKRQKAFDFANMMRRKVLEHKPNRAHYLIAELERDYDVTVITQNGDDYHTQAGSSDVIYLHGEAMKNCSMRNPYVGWEIDRENPDIHVGDKAPDGSQVRSYVIYFDENIDRRLWERAVHAAKDADYFVVVGSTMLVYPAASLFGKLKRGCKIFVIDPRQLELPAEYSGLEFESICDKASSGLETLIAKLGES